MDFERPSNSTAEDIETFTLIGDLYEDETFNREYYERLRQIFAREWRKEGFGDPLLFIERDGSSVAISRFDGAKPYPGHECIRVHVQWLEDGETRDDERTVIIPPEIMAGELPEDIHANNVVFYEFPAGEDDMFLFELDLRDPDPDGSLVRGVSWLREVFGDTLSSQRSGLKPARLRDEDGLRGVRLDEISPFYERDF